jgi:hypothetical protein
MKTLGMWNDSVEEMQQRNLRALGTGPRTDQIWRVGHNE